MIFFKLHKTKKAFKGLLFLVAFFISLSAIVLGAYLLFEKKYENKVYPGVYVGNINLGGKSFLEVQTILNEKVNLLDQNGISFRYQGKQVKVFPTLSSVEGDLAYQIIDFEVDRTVNEVINLGRGAEPITDLFKKIELFLNKKKSPLYFSINKEEIYKLLKSNFSKFELEPVNANLVYNDGEFTIENEKLGNVINYKESILLLEKKLASFDTSEIVMKSQIAKPKIYKNKTTGLDLVAQEIIDNAPLTIKFDSSKHEIPKIYDQSWTINKDQVIEWLKIKTEFSPLEERDKILVGLDQKLVKEYFDENISPEIQIEPQNAKFEIKDGRVVEFQVSKDGLEVNFDATFNLLENKFIKGGENDLTLAMTELKSELQTEEVNDLGINEVIGTGHSDFSGSPKNRRHNIATGAASLNGLIIKPEEEFSLITALGDIDGESGYLPELVIKGNQTIAEYGGGLCQIGTTLFRTVLQSGMPVTMRRNHSYRVSYYEPAGTDATIYDPWPDFRFKNDSEYNILIQTRIEGDDIYFDFWGTEDGREVELTEPTIYNITKPAPTKYVETLDLPVGETRCTEHAHNGADAYFDYIVKYSEDNIVEERFSSHYVPWREVCLIGVEKLSENGTATSTEESIE
ncbi:hypothetical protein C0584_02245 [Candidatus Parcubacteria bacterium]|nr:MAG: hypothetical protein C0584_02245 [Candidatus Parcubacteria bacterium]